MDYAKSFRDLEIYKLARRLAVKIFEISKKFPREEMYSLTDQMRKSSRSEGAQIAEAWAKRLYVKHFVNKLTDADGEQLETQHWVETAMDWSYISAEEANDLLSEYFRLGRMVNATIKKAPLFCENTANNQ